MTSKKSEAAPEGWVRMLQLAKELKELSPEVEDALDVLIENGEMSAEQMARLVKPLLLAPSREDSDQVLGGVIKR